MEFRFERMQLSHIPDVQRLYKRVYGRTISADSIRRKYDTAVLGKDCYACIAYHDSRPVAFYGVVPLPIRYGDKSEWSAHITDSMTDPEYEKKGLYARLAFFAFEELKKAGFTCAWGLPNQNSEVAVTKKQGFVYNRRFTCFVLTQPEKRYYKILRKLVPSRATANHRGYLNACISERPFSAVANSGVHIERSERYLTYKRFTGSIVIEIEGVQCWVNTRNGLFVGEIASDDPDELRRTIRRLIALQRTHKGGSLVFQVLPETTLFQVLQEFEAQQFPSWSICYLDFCSQLPLDQFALSFSDLDTF